MPARRLLIQSNARARLVVNSVWVAPTYNKTAWAHVGVDAVWWVWIMGDHRHSATNEDNERVTDTEGGREREGERGSPLTA